jgi:hypothetical protein
MQIETAAAAVEQFTIRIDATGASDAPRLVIEWGTFRWRVPVVPAGAPD